MSISIVVNENDFESPGYEYLRSHQNMNNLYHKLVALNYQRDFCFLYRCPPIHKYYFSLPSKNLGEQQFRYTCLCAWLIKDKCQMNLELEPEEYGDSDIIIDVILEALTLLLLPEDDLKEKRNSISFPAARLKNGFGPEVIWSMNILADRALELMFESEPNDRKIKILYNNKASSDINRQSVINSITIGQPFVGGGLTTRPLGSYQIDDAALLFEEDVQVDIENSSIISNNDDFNSDDWYNKVERVAQLLDSARLLYDSSKFKNYLQLTVESKKTIQEFVNDSKSLMDAISSRIDRQLQVITGREKFIQTSLKAEIDDFLKIWRNYSEELARHNDLVKQVNSKTDGFESHNERLRGINIQIETRIKELNDGSKLRELELLTSKLKGENNEFNIKIGLLLTVYSKVQAKLVS